MTVRTIARLDVKTHYVVNPVNFEGLRKVRNLSKLVKKYHDQGADKVAINTHVIQRISIGEGT